MSYPVRLSPLEMVQAREDELRAEGRVQERARLLALLKRHGLIEIRDGQVFTPQIVGWEHDAKFIQEWDGTNA